MSPPNRIADTVTRGLARAAIPAEGGHVHRLTLRLPAGASEADIARAFERAIADRRHREERR
ncbi:hypothetical protein [Sphingomonas quercus]|uniref:Uncharacterized protein n=1 Tax=Sphingomonas quercus TaxID=2842451 RepID=A0ABS6BP08_9SPHN|nr:hypothetical protein [Sphingomonas quercus]MBU3078999.1 hypothetical protein [Sphingomonas quercus]